MISIISFVVLLLHICILAPPAVELYEELSWDPRRKPGKLSLKCLQGRCSQGQDGRKKLHRLHRNEPREYYDYWQDAKLIASFVTGVSCMNFLEWYFGRNSMPPPDHQNGFKVKHFELFQCAI
eukprot:TRINITY_DN51947_c0_g1_i1.p1 TRINITY_DN51947_c0_g1~~TRINITY_DN51947_c0_g1_i1.p1  ORF type:complete len:123 (-),score=14.86 TRINITY_DN51947_c0_g1_i1:495-863(-)